MKIASIFRLKRSWITIIVVGFLMWWGFKATDQFRFWHRKHHSFFWGMEDRIKFNAMSETKQRAFLHKVLQCPYTENRYAALYLFPVADKSSVPLLIEVIPSLQEFDDSERLSGVETLVAITNHDFGFDQDSWKAWWEENNHKNLDEIRLDGFREQGLPVTMPPDLAFTKALLKNLGNRSAQRFIKDIPDELLNDGIQQFATSIDKEERLNIVRYLGAQRWHDGAIYKPALAGIYQREYSESQLKLEERLLKTLAHDPEQDVRIQALTKLNYHLRATCDFSEEQYVRHYEEFEDSLWRIKPGLDNEHVVLMLNEDRRDGSFHTLKLYYYNVVTHEREWEYAYKYFYVHSRPEFFRGKILFYIDSHIHCLDVATGKVQWKLLHEPKSFNKWNAIELHGGKLYLAFENKILAIDVETGETLWKATFPDVWGKRYPKSIITIDDSLVAVTANVVYALNPENGVIEWEIDLLPGREDKIHIEPSANLQGMSSFNVQIVDRGRRRRRGDVRSNNPPEPDKPTRLIHSFAYKAPYFYVQTYYNEVIKIDAKGTIVDQAILISPALNDAQNRTPEVTTTNKSIILSDYMLYTLANHANGIYLSAYQIDSMELIWEQFFENGKGDKRIEFFAGKEKLIYLFDRKGGALDKYTGEIFWEVDMKDSFPEFQQVLFREEYFLTCGPAGPVELRDYATGEVVMAYHPLGLDGDEILFLDDSIVAGGTELVFDFKDINNVDYIGKLWILSLPDYPHRTPSISAINSLP